MRPKPSPDKDLRVLVVDDNADMREYIRHVLEPHWTVQTAGDGGVALAAIRENPPDLVLSDVMMPVLDGFELLRVLKADVRTADVPFIMLSARAGEGASVEGLQAGADDYLIKPFAAVELVARVRVALARRQAERRLAFHAYLLDMIGEAVIATDVSGRILYWNRFAESLFGWRVDEALGKNAMKEFLAGETPEMEEVSRRVLQGENWSGEIQAHRRDGSTFTAALILSPFVDAQGRAIGVVAVTTDVTSRKKMEEDLSRIQKLDSIGVLAGGIAHDFNNILTALFGNIALARLTISDERASSALGDAEKAFWRARALTNQLLTFAKGGAPVCRVGRLEPLLREAPQLAITGSNITCRLVVAPDLWLVNFDPGQISQTLHNLVINAKEAMPQGGTISITADNVVLQEDEVAELPPGSYVCIAVADGGEGIAPENLPRIFDPYFSTKATGTGLGLAITYSIVKKHGGHIEAESNDRGSTFRVYLPASPCAAEVGESDPQPLRKGAGRVLLMDDDEGVLRVGEAMLTRLGYEVALAKEGTEALTLYQRALATGDPFVHVILDLTVRDGMGGKECLQKLRSIDPRARVLVSSGYSNDPVMADHRRHGFDGVISKPYRPEDLSEALYLAEMNGPRSSIAGS